MQSKVSMVVPCYNKVQMIGAMLESVIGQIWDNIELILVNDGSTDGTRQIISQYEPKIRIRGYELIIVDQENGGCCAAVYAGLIRVTGEYYCLVDCDDAIDPEYVSRMAGWLDTHSDYEWAACSYKECKDNQKTVSNTIIKNYPQDTSRLLEKWLFRVVISTVWIYMARVSYIKKCGMTENWCVENRKTYEPLVAIPLMAGKGKLKYFHEDLYQYNIFASDLYKFYRYEDITSFYNDFLYLYNWSIKRLTYQRTEKKRLLTLARLSYIQELFLHCPNAPDGVKHLETLAVETSQFLNTIFEPSPYIQPKTILLDKGKYLFTAIMLSVLNIEFEEAPLGRVIGYGALGRMAKRLLPCLNATKWRPTELWDKAGEGTDILKPDFASLADKDTILLFPIDRQIEEEIREELVGRNIRVFNLLEITHLISTLYYPQFKNARLK
ncbi:MAG: glycosyltransferase family 2 protein [Clostridiales bacterium]|jgi:glycosyltransferase involved in cell wall biosynthesis|nr:glycosyltransferase family 2 protein [Clostridiales bacterium]